MLILFGMCAMNFIHASDQVRERSKTTFSNVLGELEEHCISFFDDKNVLKERFFVPSFELVICFSKTYCALFLLPQSTKYYCTKMGDLP